jgi:2-hydroxy-5-methyl-1-naphthoate 7-hydroxylase
MDVTPPRCPFLIDPTGTDIPAEASRLRTAGPATQVQLPGLPGNFVTWAITDPGLAKRLMTHPGVSKDAQQWHRYGEIPREWPLRIWTDVRNALTAYGDDHRRLRRLIGPAFSPSRIRALRPRIEEVTATLLDRIAPDENQIADLREQFTLQLPLLVITELLGMPPQMQAPFLAVLEQIFDTGLGEEDAAKSRRAVYELLGTLIETKRAEPGDDLTSALIAAHDDESNTSLSPQELADTVLLIIGAGHETTVNLLGNTIVNLLAHPGQLELIRSTIATWADAIEETLRRDAPVATILPRFAIETIHDGETGLTFKRGDMILIHFASIGRAPEIHGADADRFNVTRHTRREHLVFGHGVHYCLGAQLARMEAEIALTALFDRYPRLTLAVSPEALLYLPSFISNGPQAIPVFLNGAPSADLSVRQRARKARRLFSLTT